MFQVADLIITEFFDQGDKERSELKIQPQVKTILTLRFVHGCLCIIKYIKRVGKNEIKCTSCIEFYHFFALHLIK